MLLREAQPADVPFLREMLYEAVFWREQANKPSLAVGLAYPEVHKALAGWGERARDTAVIALYHSTPVGAAWYRFWTDTHFDRGYVDEKTAVLAIGVHHHYRRQGIGTALLGWLINHATQHAIPRISLAVAKDNIALNLYRQQGFSEYADTGDSFIMVRSLLSPA